MQWTDRIRQVKIILVVAAVIIAVASLLVSHFLVRDLSIEERHRMEVWAQALHALNEADETTDVSLVLSVMEGNNTIPVIVMDADGNVTDYRNIDMDAKTLYIKAYIREHKRFSFRQLLEKQHSKTEIIVTFLVMLEEMKLGEIEIEQDETQP